MQREIFEVYAKIVDANGNYSTLANYPKSFDSHTYNDDIAKAQQRAEGEWHECCGAMCKRDDRQLQVAMLIRASDGMVLACKSYGAIAEV